MSLVKFGSVPLVKALKNRRVLKQSLFQNGVKDWLKIQTAECNWDEGT